MKAGSILVTGGAGFFGSAFVRAALRALTGAPEGSTWGLFSRVITLDLLTYAGHTDNLEGAMGDPRHSFVRGDVNDGELVGRLLEEHRVTAVVHFAAETHVDRSIDDPGPFVSTNVGGTVRLLEEVRAALGRRDATARAGFRFVHVSTDEVYGSARPGERFGAGSPLSPRSPYAASKAAADGFVHAYHATFGVPAVVLRPSNLFGPRQFAEKLIPLSLRRALAGSPIDLYGDGLHQREWLFVEDACEAVLAALARGVPGEVYLVGSGEQRHNLEVVEQLCDMVDAITPVDATLRACGLKARRELLRFVADRPGHDRAYGLDSGPTRAALGWAPRVDFATGLERTVRWFVANPGFLARTAASYDGGRLGLGSAARGAEEP